MSSICITLSPTMSLARRRSTNKKITLCMQKYLELSNEPKLSPYSCQGGHSPPHIDCQVSSASIYIYTSHGGEEKAKAIDQVREHSWSQNKFGLGD